MINVRKILPWLLVILWMSLIFYLSHQPVAESNKLSNRITEKCSLLFLFNPRAISGKWIKDSSVASSFARVPGTFAD